MKKKTPITTSLPRHEQLQIKNEVLFRKANERVEKELLRLNARARKDGAEVLVSSTDLLLYFYCECSNNNCRERIALTLARYQTLHVDRSNFIVLPNHETNAVEVVISRNVSYTVVDKFVTPPDVAGTLSLASD